MTAFRRQGWPLRIRAISPLRFGSGTGLDPLAVLLHEGWLWYLDTTEFVRLLQPRDRKLFQSKAGGANPLLDCHLFYYTHLHLALSASRKALKLTPAIANIHQQFLLGLGSASFSVDCNPQASDPGGHRLRGVHVKAAIQAAYKAKYENTPLLCGVDDALLQQGTGERRVTLKAQITRHIPVTMAGIRSNQWCEITTFSDDACFASHIYSNAIFHRNANARPLIMEELVGACNMLYREQLQSQVTRLQAVVPSLNSATPMATFIARAKAALSDTDRSFVLRIGSGTNQNLQRKKSEVFTESVMVWNAENVAQPKLSDCEPLGWVHVTYRNDAC